MRQDEQKMVRLAMISGGAIVVILVLFCIVALALGDTTPKPAPIITPWPTLQITPAPQNTPTPTPTHEPVKESNEQVNDTSYQAYQNIANNASGNQTPNDYTANLTGNCYVDYTALASMYPWVPNRYNDSSEYPWMWTPEKFSREYSGQGDAQRVMLYNLWKEKQVVKAPEITFEILHNDDVTPYDFNREALVLGHYYDGYFRFTNIGDKPFQGNIAIAINASLFFAGTMIHLENKIITEQYLSLYTGQSNDFYKKWLIDGYNGAPIPTGCLNIVIELRDLSDGSTICSKTIKPIIARDPNGDGVLTF
jgi:hypothetical protein